MDRNKLIASAQKYVQKGQIAKAIGTYRKLAASDPSDVRVLLKIGDLEARNGQVESAIDTYTRAADHFEERGFVLKAVAVYKQLQRLTPDDTELLLKMADAYVQVSLLGEARKLYTDLADNLERAGNTQRMASVLRRLIELDPEDVPIRMRLAQSFEGEGKASDAAKLLTELAGVLADQGRWREYLGVAERVERLGGKLQERDRRLAIASLHNGAWARAVDAARAALRADDEDLDTIDVLADALCELGRTQEAIESLRAAYHRFGERGDRERETHVRRRLRRLDPGAFSDASIRSRSLTMSGAEVHLPDADLEDVMTEDDLNLVVEEVDVYLKYGLHDKATQMLEDGLLYHPGHLPALTKLRDIHRDAGSPVDAADVCARIGLALLDIDDEEQAQAALDEALSLLPEEEMPTAELITLEQRLGGTKAPDRSAPPAQEPQSTPPAQELHDESLASGEFELMLSSDAIIPDALDEQLDDVDRLIAEGQAVEANHLLVALLADFPEHSELLLSMIESMAVEISNEGSLVSSDEDSGDISMDDLLISVDDLMESPAEPQATPAPRYEDEPEASLHQDRPRDDELVDILDLDLDMALMPDGDALPEVEPPPPGHMPKDLGVRFSPSERVLATQDGSPLAEAIRRRRQGDALSAIDVLENERFGNYPVAVTWELALAGMEMGLYAEAVESFQRLQSVPSLSASDQALLRYASAVALEALDQPEQAIAALEAIPEEERVHMPDFAGRWKRCASR